MAEYKFHSEALDLTNVRISFPNLFKPTKAPGSDGLPAYNATFLVDKSKPLATVLLNLEKKIKVGFKTFSPDQNFAIFDGDKMQNPRPEYAGCVVVKARRSEDKGRPVVVDQTGQPISPDLSRSIYPGCYVNAKVYFFGTDRGGKNKICCRLNGVQKYADGEPLTSDNVTFGAVNVGDEDAGDELTF